MLETHSVKATAVGESNNAGSEGGAPDVAAILQFFSKVRIFLGMFRSKFLLTTAFLNTSYFIYCLSSYTQT